MVSCEIIALPRIYEKSFVGSVVLAAVSRWLVVGGSGFDNNYSWELLRT